MVEFENRYGGKVLFYRNGIPKEIARVFRPMAGCGRFSGSFFQDVGRIRANHPGVLCVSTSPRGQEGGFQIVPCYHCNSSNLTYVKDLTVYMVIGPVDVESKALEGTEPIYMHYIRPGDIAEAKINGVWQTFPTAVGKDLWALQNVEAVRIRPFKP